MSKPIIVAVLSLMLAGPVAGQERTTTAEQFCAVLDDLRDWPPESKEIPKKNARKWERTRAHATSMHDCSRKAARCNRSISSMHSTAAMRT